MSICQQLGGVCALAACIPTMAVQRLFRFAWLELHQDVLSRSSDGHAKLHLGVLPDHVWESVPGSGVDNDGRWSDELWQ